MLLYHGISLLLLSVLVLIVGLIKPKWILFWMEHPTRMIIVGVSMAMFMGGAVMFGEGNSQKKEEVAKQAATATTDQPVNDTPAPEQPKAKPVTVPSATAPAPDTSTNELRPD